MQPAPKAIGDGSKVELGFAIHEGPQILIDHVLIVGNQRTSRDTILREVQLKSGQPLSQQQEDETRTQHHRRWGCSGASTSPISSFPASRTAATSSSPSRKRR